jgi:hypothetical protein
MVVHLFFALTVSVRWRLLFPTVCWSINTKSMVRRVVASNTCVVSSHKINEKVYKVAVARLRHSQPVRGRSTPIPIP